MLRDDPNKRTVGFAQYNEEQKAKAQAAREQMAEQIVDALARGPVPMSECMHRLGVIRNSYNHTRFQQAKRMLLDQGRIDQFRREGGLWLCLDLDDAEPPRAAAEGWLYGERADDAAYRVRQRYIGRSNNAAI